MKSRQVVDLRGRQRAPLAPPPPSRNSYSPPRRKSALRQKRMMGRVTIVSCLFLLMTGIFVGLSYMAHTPEFVVHTIEVNGTESLSTEEVRLYAQSLLDDGSFHIFPPNNVFLFSPRVIEKAIQNFYPVVKVAHVTRESILATKASVTIEERKSYALWCDGTTDCFTIDDSGFLFATATSSGQNNARATSYLFSGDLSTSTAIIGNSYAAAHFPGITTFLTRLGQAGFTPLGARVDNDSDFSVPLHDGFYIKASYGQDATALVSNLKLILQSDALKGNMSKLEYIDLRFGNRAYYKLLGSQEATSSASH